MKGKPSFEEQLAALEAEHDRSFAKIGYYRCFDGCPDTALKTKGEIEELIMKEIKKYEPEAHCAYFPGEELYQVHRCGKEIGRFMSERKDALLDGLRVLRERQPIAEAVSG